VSNFSSIRKLEIIIKITTKALYKMSYSSHSQWLYERICELRDKDNLSFEKIAKRLTLEGIKSARYCTLMAEHVYSAYKKGKIREARLTENIKYELLGVTLIA
jgi:hypothetical protein